MKTEILSLKSVYRFLTTKDYPVYSNGIISKNNKRGLTINIFCDKNILVDFKERKNGKIIWRMEGSRNRYLSEICNRSGNQSIHREYIKEVLAVISQETVLRQIFQVMSFLLERQYNIEAFRRKLLAYVELIEAEDEKFTQEVALYFKRAIEQYVKMEKVGVETNAFCCSWFLTYFILFALTGNDKNENYILKIKEDKSYSLDNMLKLYADVKQGITHEVNFLTGSNTELSRKPLGAGHFFGRQEELFDLIELFKQGGHYLISGIGGSGKTELMRQFLRICQEEKMADDIAIIQYEGGLAHSMVKAFPRVYCTEVKDGYKEILASIQRLDGRKVLLIIDNVDSDVNEEELEALCKLPVTIFITSRYQKLNGFKAYPLKSIKRDVASLIFRDNYGRMLMEGEKEVLNELINHELWCHTLTLRLLARTARNNSWSLIELKEKLEHGNVFTGCTENEQYNSLKQIYVQMYDLAKLSKDELALLRVMAALPYRNYELIWIKKYLQLIVEEEKIEGILKMLWEKGWLEESETGYSMHSFISECVLSLPLTEEECSGFFDEVIREWNTNGKLIGGELLPEIIYENDKCMQWNPQLIQTTMLVRPMLEKISGRFSETYVNLYLIAITLESIYLGITKQGITTFEKIKGKTTFMMTETKVAISITQSALCNVLKTKELEKLEQDFNVAKINVSISEDMKYTFAECLGLRYYHAGAVAKAEALVDYVIENCKNNAILIGAYSLKAYTLVQRGDYDGYLQWLTKGIEIGRSQGYERGKEMQLLMSNLCDLYMALRQFEEAEKLLEELGKISENRSYFLKQHLLQRKGNLFMYRGDEGFGVEELTESYKMAKYLYSDTEQANYAVAIVDLAMALNKSKRYDESAERYKEALDIYASLDGYEFEKHRILNNMSVMYLDQNMPNVALEYLSEAYERGKVLGGLALGETANNLSKAYHAIGDREKEIASLNEAIPILEQFYGKEHPKVEDAKARFHKN